MFGLTFEKILIIAIVAVCIIGPAKLPLYASRLATFVKQVRGYADAAKSRIKDEMGPDFDEVEWKKLDPRQYDPRRIIRDALFDDMQEKRPDVGNGEPAREPLTSRDAPPAPMAAHAEPDQPPIQLNT